MADMPVIDYERCDACGLCVSACRCNILVIIDGRLAVVQKGKCNICSQWCTTCEDLCPHQAITCPFEVISEDGH